MRFISVIWTKYSDPLAELVYYLTGRSYTHAAISLDEDCSYYYSFCFKGFCQETLEKYRRRGVTKSLQLRLAVPDDVYEGLRRKLRFVERNAQFYEYTKFGLFCALLRIPLRWHRRYFCSQFIAELLESTGATQLSRPACLTLPNHLLRDLRASPALFEVVSGVV
ncbi:hypothetical protein D1646_19095 [Pseudoflavonifractor sp. 60]|uniref:hypothetical protein n=1 Tax=Pseudoflavonifractor sp. 60 TaxID=2304576 RepID=UPI00136A719A|nr:hypothetical protein [Pseudoflavonifractor sp. 60]NBI68852.1 hypothetical protein [Pseudoflavonifractor sp. 60]